MGQNDPSLKSAPDPATQKKAAPTPDTAFLSALILAYLPPPTDTNRGVASPAAFPIFKVVCFCWLFPYRQPQPLRKS